MAATATIGVYEELMFQFDDLGDLGPDSQVTEEDLLSSGGDDHTNYILRHSQSDPMLTSPASRELMRSRQKAIACRLISLQACGHQRYLQQQQQQQHQHQQLQQQQHQNYLQQKLHGRHSIEEDFTGGQCYFNGCRRVHDFGRERGVDDDIEDDEDDIEDDEDAEEAAEDDINIAPPTIEQIKDDYNSCFSCGVSWSDNHVSLDCKECGGYALTRPCLACEGECSALWTRDLAASHDHRQAQWQGHCSRRRTTTAAVLVTTATTTTTTTLATTTTTTTTTKKTAAGAAAIITTSTHDKRSMNLPEPAPPKEQLTMATVSAASRAPPTACPEGGLQAMVPPSSPPAVKTSTVLTAVVAGPTTTRTAATATATTTTAAAAATTTAKQPASSAARARDINVPHTAPLPTNALVL